MSRRPASRHWALKFFGALLAVLALAHGAWDLATDGWAWSRAALTAVEVGLFGSIAMLGWSLEERHRERTGRDSA